MLIRNTGTTCVLARFFVVDGGLLPCKRKFEKNVAVSLAGVVQLIVNGVIMWLLNTGVNNNLIEGG